MTSENAGAAEDKTYILEQWTIKDIFKVFTVLLSRLLDNLNASTICRK